MSLTSSFTSMLLVFLLALLSPRDCDFGRLLMNDTTFCEILDFLG